MKWTRLVPAIVAGTLLGCSSDSGPSEPEDTGDTGQTVAVRNNFFDPSTVAVPVNGTVTWAWNSGGVEHNVTFESAPSSATQGSGSFARKFETAGTFAYVCTIHVAEGMTGVVNVTGGSAGGGGGGDDTGGGGGGYP